MRSGGIALAAESILTSSPGPPKPVILILRPREKYLRLFLVHSAEYAEIAEILRRAPPTQDDNLDEFAE